MRRRRDPSASLRGRSREKSPGGEHDLRERTPTEASLSPPEFLDEHARANLPRRRRETVGGSGHPWTRVHWQRLTALNQRLVKAVNTTTIQFFVAKPSAAVSTADARPPEAETPRANSPTSSSPW